MVDALPRMATPGMTNHVEAQRVLEAMMMEEERFKSNKLMGQSPPSSHDHPQCENAYNANEMFSANLFCYFGM
jgi:hypothetical protein